MDTQQLFDRTVQDLERKANSNDPYELLMSAVLLRKLLLDDYPLVDQVNGSRKHKLKFVVGSHPHFLKKLMSPTLTYVHGDQICGDAQSQNESLSKKEFLRFVIIVQDGSTYSIKDVIRYSAHVAGAVHKGAPRSAADNALAKIDSQFTLMGHATSAIQLRAIGRAVVAALKPLVVSN